MGGISPQEKEREIRKENEIIEGIIL